MFMGEYAHNIDKKGRMIIPAKFREELDMKIIITRGLDGCLNAYTKQQWEIIYEQLLKLPTTATCALAFYQHQRCGVEKRRYDHWCGKSY